MPIRILVVEDDEHICRMAGRFLRNAGFIVDTCMDGDSALEKIYDSRYQLAVFDIMLPGVSGHDLLKELRKISDTPVLMITALGDDQNQLTAFINEADDYVIKPFSMQILVKRAEAILRRSGTLKKEVCAGRLTLYPEEYKAVFDGKDIILAPKEFEILMLIAKNKGKIITHENLITKIWGYDFAGNEGIVHANIKKLRSKLPVNIIRTVKGVGYCLEDNGYEE